METIEVEINKIKPDPNQPRKYIDDDFLKGMAKGMITVGVINPIELDKDLMIVTGELRWRAAKIAGLKTIPAKIIEIDKDKRFLHQMHSNIQNVEISKWDIGVAAKKLLNDYPDYKEDESLIIGINAEKNFSWLDEKFGISRDSINEMFILFEEQKIQLSIQKKKNELKELRK